jgi:hypothetical protein
MFLTAYFREQGRCFHTLVEMIVKRTIEQRLGDYMTKWVGLSLAVSILAQASMANPVLTPGVWKDITPAGINCGGGYEAMAVDQKNPSTLFVGYEGQLLKSTDAGSTWRPVGKVPVDWTNTDHMGNTNHVAVDPDNSNNVYACGGVRGSQLGFWLSTDGGETFARTSGWAAAVTAAKYIDDCYDLAVDPGDFRHVLVSFHGAWNWGDPVWGNSSGVLESKDMGASWIIHPPKSEWGTGHSINFLYDPAKGKGNSNTWLLQTQGSGMWRTSDGGNTWLKVSDHVIQHGGGNVYYASNGVLYASGTPQNLRSTDNGLTWTQVGPGTGFNYIIGDGTNLYTMQCLAGGKWQTSSETDGLTWKNQNDQTFSMGPYLMAFDKTNRIVYSASWTAGVFALKGDGVSTAARSIRPEITKHGAYVSNRLIFSGAGNRVMASRKVTGAGTAALFDIKGRILTK